MKLKTKVTIIVSAFSIFAFFIVVTVLSFSNYSQHYFESNAFSSLTKILEINELHTLEYRYNSYAVVYATRYDMETYDTYKDVFDEIYKDFTDVKNQSAKSFENFRAEQLLLIEENSIFSQFYQLCVTQNDFEDLKEFLDQSRKNALKMTSTRKYAVAYEGIITAGIKEPVTFSIDTEQKIVTVIVPRAEIIDTNVNIPADTQTKSVIYSDKKYVNTDQWNREALSACRADLRGKISTDMEFLNIATENARDTIVALLRPFENQSGYEFKVTISC